MTIEFECPHCTTVVEADGRASGRTSHCPACHEAVEIPAVSLQPGCQLGGYRLGRHLGSGAMGEVYQAEQLSMQRQVALKILPPTLTRNPLYLERFHQEVRSLARLDHPHIVHAYGAGQESGFHFLSMRYVDGQSLQEWIDQHGPMGELDALNVALQVAPALEHAWSRHGILHRDIKPANLMLDREGNVLVMDLGISKSIHEDSKLTVAGTIVGTPSFMSPEQATGASLDCRSDMFSLGATLYYMLSGQLPYEGSSAMEVLSQLVLSEPAPLDTVCPHLSASCCQFVGQLMALDPADRFPSWPAAIHQLQSLAGRPDQGQPSSSQQRRRRTAAAALTAAALLVFVLALSMNSEPTSESPLGALAPMVEQPALPPPIRTDSTDTMGIASMYEYAMEYSLQHPDRPAEALQKFEKVAAAAAGTPYADKAAVMIAQLQAEIPTAPPAVPQAPEDLRDTLRSLVREGRYAQALRRLEEERPHLTDNQYHRLQRILQHLRRNTRPSQPASPPPPDPNQAKAMLAVELDAIAQLLLTGQYQAARAHAAQLAEQRHLQPVSADVQTLHTLGTCAVQWPAVMANTYRQAIGHTRVLHLANGPLTLSVDRVTGSTLYGKEQITTEHGIAHFSRTIPYSDLTVNERLTALGNGQAPIDHLRRGLLCLHAGESTRARQAFQLADHPLGSALANAISTSE